MAMMGYLQKCMHYALTFICSGMSVFVVKLKAFVKWETGVGGCKKGPFCLILVHRLMPKDLILD